MDSILRIAFVYFVLMAAFRFVGKRELGQLSPFELVTLLLIPEIFSEALARGDYSLTHATSGAFALLSLVFFTSLVGFHSPRIDRLIAGNPTVLAHEGRFLERNLRRERITPEEIYAEMHKAGLDDLGQVRWAILETDGKIAVIPSEARGTPAKKDDGRTAAA
jgi:uncharacterized membrane protein YcaP (DUF421 family)